MLKCTKDTGWNTPVYPRLRRGLNPRHIDWKSKVLPPSLTNVLHFLKGKKVQKKKDKSYFLKIDTSWNHLCFFFFSCVFFPTILLVAQTRIHTNTPSDLVKREKTGDFTVDCTLPRCVVTSQVGQLIAFEVQLSLPTGVIDNCSLWYQRKNIIQGLRQNLSRWQNYRSNEKKTCLINFIFTFHYV